MSENYSMMRGAGGGERKPPYVVQYQHKGASWVITIPWAESWEDAEMRLRSIGGNGKVIGSNASSVPANAVTLPFAHLWVTLVCWFRNLGR